VINLHGRIVSVIDLGSFFDLPKTDIMNARQVIVLQAGSMEIGVLADEVQGIYPLAAGKLQTAIPGGPGRRVEYVKGIAENRMVVLDAEKILSDPMLLVDTH
jgi:purine-binding chemotaxis protein CheW